MGVQPTLRVNGIDSMLCNAHCTTVLYSSDKPMRKCFSFTQVEVQSVRKINIDGDWRLEVQSVRGCNPDRCWLLPSAQVSAKVENDNKGKIRQRRANRENKTAGRETVMRGDEKRERER